MSSIYCTADKIGMVSGGGIVTKNELRALHKYGSVMALGADQLSPSTYGLPQDPFLTDYIADEFVQKELSANGPMERAHFYSGTFTKTVRRLREAGVPVTYTAAAHDPVKSREEYEKLGMPYSYPHMVNKRLFDLYVEGYKLANTVICPSTASANLMRSFGCKTVRVVPHGVELPPGISPVAPKKFNVAYLGQVGPDKGLIYLLQAWKKLNYKDSRLVIAGRGSEAVASMYRTHGGGNVQIRGFVDSVSEVYDECSVYVQPSVTEGFGIEILESMAHGRPVIGAQGAGAAELIEDGIEGFQVPSRDPDAIADRIDWFRKNPGRLFLMSVAARKKAEDYTWDAICVKYQNVWEGN